MHQHTCAGDIVGVVIRNIEVVDGYRSFKDFMLDFFDNYILAVDENEDITGTELNRIRQSLDGGIEGMRGNSIYG